VPTIECRRTHAELGPLCRRSSGTRYCQQRLRWHVHALDPALHVPLGALDRKIWLERRARQPGRREQATERWIARDLLTRSMTLICSILAPDRELRQRTQTLAPRLYQGAVWLMCGADPVAAADNT
jgi:hypothetical protein